ncbi:MAG: ABC transporter substrate-binding protein [Thermoleophilia bacterium]|nr:ABC transporter substrate-binding protein [Thermoleophilia bacterium]
MDRREPWEQMISQPLSRRRLLKLSAGVGLGAVAGTVLAACGGSETAPTETSPAETTPAETGQAETTPAELTSVSFAMDWTPNTNHTGFFVADSRGYYAEEGIKIDILPYNNVSPDTLVGAGQANFGISFGTSIPFSVAAGTPIVSVLPITQNPIGALVYLNGGGITRPADLDGKTYAGFGAPYEVPIITEVIKADGGTGEFETVTLDTFAYEAVLSGQADFAWAFTTWEGVDYELKGEDFGEIHFEEHGFPTWYEVVLMGGSEWMAANPDLAKGFIRATKRGFDDVIADPAATADILVAANPDSLGESAELARASSQLLAENHMLDAEGNFGTQTLENWTNFPKFLYELGLLVDADGAVLTAEPDYASYFTNDYTS